MILSILLDTLFSNFHGYGFYCFYNLPSSQSENYDAVLVYNGTKRSEYHYIPVRRPAATSYAAIEIDKELNNYTNLDTYVKGLKGIDLLEAKNSMIMAEYLIYRSNLSKTESANRIIAAWGRVKVQMTQNLKEVENELEAQTATKLDIARLITGLSQISGEVDKELLANRETAENSARNTARQFDNRLIAAVNKLKHEAKDSELLLLNELSKTRRMFLLMTIPLYIFIIIVVIILLR